MSHSVSTETCLTAYPQKHVSQRTHRNMSHSVPTETCLTAYPQKHVSQRTVAVFGTMTNIITMESRDNMA
ncbi:hypothetical protein BgiBS90_012435 [Biomphalaria glabrata]|nr:hypothetical protein BgiBS90_012435 [Biomphalaria glabrata]